MSTLKTEQDIFGITGSVAGLEEGLEWMKYLPDNIFKEAQHYFQQKDQHRFLLSRWILSRLIEKVSGNTMDWSLFHKDENGAPCYEGLEGLSIAHSGEKALVVMSKYQKVGCDLQKQMSINIEDYRSVFSDKEWELIRSDEHHQRFFQYWTLKEATAKMLGLGFQIDFAQILPETDKNIVRYGSECCYISRSVNTDKYAFSVVSSSPNKHFHLLTAV